jgi:hypothetical protein
MGGVLDFAVFKDADGTEEEILSAVPQALYNTSTYDREKLRSLGNQRITERTFFGDWYDYASGLLLKGGTWKTADGLELENPPLVAVAGVNIVSGGGGLAQGPGQFAYAFLDPPQHPCPIPASAHDHRGLDHRLKRKRQFSPP